MNFDIPLSVWNLYQSILDEHGRVNELPAGRFGEHYLTQAISHSDYSNPYGPPIAQFGADGNNNAALPKVMVYDRPIDNSWVVSELPPIGSAVWQLKGKQLQIVRTSVVRAHMAGWAKTLLDPAGPYPGTPVAGDSGSVCFVREHGVWKVLGIVNTLGSCNPPFWTSEVRLPNGESIPPRWTLYGGQTAQPDFYCNEPSIIPYMTNLFLAAAPPNPWRVMSPYSANVDYGKDGVVLDVPCNFDPESVIIRGSGSDEWRFPDNYSHWHIRAWRLNESTLRLMFAKSMNCSSYSVRFNGQATIIYAEPVSQAAPPVTTPPTDNTDIIEKPAENFEPLDIIFLQAELVELRKKVESLQSENASLAISNADLRTALRNEQISHGATRAKIENYNAALNNLKV